MARNVFTFAEDSMRRIAREVFAHERKAHGNNLPPPYHIPGFYNGGKRPIIFRNTSGEEIPPFACMRVTGAELSAGDPVITIAKPSTTFQRLYLVNSRLRVGAGSTCTGIGTWLDDEPGYVLYESGTPAYGESWGPKSGQWSLAKWRYGFTIVGGLAGSGAGIRVVAKQEPVNAFLGITDETIAVDAVGDCGIYDGNDADTTNTMVDVSNRYATSIASGTKVDVVWRGGKWYIIAVRC